MNDTLNWSTHLLKLAAMMKTFMKTFVL